MTLPSGQTLINVKRTHTFTGASSFFSDQSFVYGVAPYRSPVRRSQPTDYLPQVAVQNEFHGRTGMESCGMLTWSRMLQRRKARTSRVVSGFFSQANAFSGRRRAGSPISASLADKQNVPSGAARHLREAASEQRRTGRNRRDQPSRTPRSDLTLSTLLDDWLRTSPGEALRSRELSRSMEREESPC